MMKYMKHPLGQAFLLVTGAYLTFRFIIPLMPGSAPVPQSVIIQYTLIAMLGVLVYVSTNEETWRQFKEPIHSTLVDDDKSRLRLTLLVLVPLFVGYFTYGQTKVKVGAAVQLRSIHPAPPSSITFQGNPMEITGLENPLRHQGSLEEHEAEGKRIYYQNCMPCHGDLLNGQGHFAHGFNPVPLSFTDPGTIAQLTESFVFWRIAKGGPGLPREGTPWNSAMPAWEDFLTENEIWAVTIFLYEQSGWEPRTWEEGGEGE
jgi:mono/diheme cytochrome c family protein